MRFFNQISIGETGTFMHVFVRFFFLSIFAALIKGKSA